MLDWKAGSQEQEENMKPVLVEGRLSYAEWLGAPNDIISQRDLFDAELARRGEKT
jgi:hypothetical protein